MLKPPEPDIGGRFAKVVVGFLFVNEFASFESFKTLADVDAVMCNPPNTLFTLLAAKIAVAAVVEPLPTCFLFFEVDDLVEKGLDFFGVYLAD